MSSLDRLIDLARKTGDRLIIHDPYGEKDFVILDIEQYKNLVRGKETIRQLSQKEMVQKVNRDIAIWRSDKEASEQDELWQLLAQDVQSQGFVPEENWHAVGAVVETQGIVSPPQVIAIETDEGEADPQQELTYEIPVEEPVPSPLPSTIPVQSIEWEVPVQSSQLSTSPPESNARQRMKEGLAAYVQPQSEPVPQPIPQDVTAFDNFSDDADEEELPDTSGPVFFEEPVS